MVEVSGDVVKITDKGRQKFLKYQLEQMQLKRKTDGKWRLIIYDIANLRKAQREQFRKMLKRLKFLKLQESVYLTPFICEDEIEYIKQLFDISDEVKVLKVTGIENEDIYKRFFGL